MSGSRPRTFLLAFCSALLFCFGIAAHASAFIYWTDPLRGLIGRASVDGSGVDASFITGANQPCGVTVDDKFIYWANSGSGTIGRATLDGTNVDQNFITGASEPCGPSTEPGVGLLYWANSGTGSIAQAFSDGTSVNENLIQNSGTSLPQWTATLADEVYWPNFIDNTIYRATGDGFGTQPWVSSGQIDQPLAIAVNSNGIYWVNDARQSGAEIGHANLDGSSPNGNFLSAPGACGVAVDNGSFLYWSAQGSIGRANLNGSSPNPSFIVDAINPCGLAVNADTALAGVSPSSLDFGGVLVGSGPTAAKNVTLTNSSSTSVDLEPAAPGLVGPNADQFSISGDTCGATVAPGASCTISVTFSPTSLGGKFATLTIDSNDPDSPSKVTVFGTGTDPNESISPSSLPFGSRLIGTQSAPQTVTLTNGSGASAPDVIGQATLAGADTGQFGVVSDGCSNTSLAIGASCEIQVRFAPMATGADAAQLSIPSDDPTSPATVALTGTGTAPDESVLPGSLAFGNQQTGTASPTQTVTVQNTANASGPLQVGSVALAGADPSSFDLVFDGCSGQSLSPGDSCKVGARFTPADAGTRSASIEIASNGSVSPVSVDLTGAGVAPAPAPPSNHFSLEGPRFLKGGRARLPVDVPGPGEIAMSGKGVRGRAINAQGAGTYRLLVVSTGKVRRRVLKKGTARVQFPVTFTPTGGSPATIKVRLTLVDRNTF